MAKKLMTIRLDPKQLAELERIGKRDDRQISLPDPQGNRCFHSKGQSMSPVEYRRKIETLIAEQQQVQMVNPPASVQWQNASKQIHRLAALIVESGKENSK